MTGLAFRLATGCAAVGAQDDFFQFTQILQWSGEIRYPWMPLIYRQPLFLLTVFHPVEKTLHALAGPGVRCRLNGFPQRLFHIFGVTHSLVDSSLRFPCFL